MLRSQEELLKRLTIEDLERAQAYAEDLTQGLQTVRSFPQGVTVFGSARLPQDNKYCQMAYKLGGLLAENGHAVVTGGGPGIMEAANHGAYEIGGHSIGLNITLSHEQFPNPYLNTCITFEYFFARKVSLAMASKVFVFFPGGFGTMDELSEILCLMQESKMPKMPMMNVMNGGAHADWSTDFQEYMIVPVGAGNIADAVRMGAEVFHALKSVLKERNYPVTVGDEGGYAPKVHDGNNEPLECIKLAIEKAGYQLGTDIAIAMDIAASEFYDQDHYVLKTNGDWKTAEDLINWYTWIVDNYPVVSIEDGLAENDWTNWRILNERLGSRVQLVGDDLFVTNTKLLKKGIAEHAANAILIKPNQIGTLSETIEAVLVAKGAGYKTVMSHRSGETEDVSIAHLAVGLGTGQIKTGSLSRSERIAKYNELIRIADTNSRLGLAKPF